MIHYRIEGEGEPLLLLHGAFASLHTFEPWVKELSNRYKVIRYDLPGFGLTGPNMEDDYSMKTHLFYLDALITRLEIEQCYMVGSSLGGWLTWEYALLHPEKVKKIVLVDAAGFLDSASIPLPFKMARTPFLNNVIKYAIRKDLLANFLKDVYFDKTKVTPQLIQRYYDLFSRKGNAGAFLKLVNNKPKENTKKLKNLKTPTLVMWGKEDAWIPVANAYRFHNLLPHNELIIYDRVGHIPMEEIPVQTAEDLVSFLEQ
jgi:pimeloyl-ACP methyl ester carboxylesterase